MTNAPADLLGLRSQIQALTGLSPNDVGIVGDAAHARSGGYHIGRSGLQSAGVWLVDYSVRLSRDRGGCTESASATDIGAGWKQGRAAWLRWNNLLVAALHAGDPALAAVRAVNYSPDGTAKRRTDREAGWSVVSSGDTVDIHTHIEWYRDTEGHRQVSLDRIVALARQAATGGIVLASTVTEGDPVLADDIRTSWGQGLGQYLAAVERTAIDPTLTNTATALTQLTALQTAVAAIAAKVGAPAQVALTADQLAAITAAIVNHPQTPLGDADKPAIEAAVAAAFAKAFPAA